MGKTEVFFIMSLLLSYKVNKNVSRVTRHASPVTHHPSRFFSIFATKH